MTCSGLTIQFLTILVKRHLVTGPGTQPSFCVLTVQISKSSQQSLGEGMAQSCLSAPVTRQCLGVSALVLMRKMGDHCRR